jgi:hypothetical protein
MTETYLVQAQNNDIGAPCAFSSFGELAPDVCRSLVRAKAL